MAAWNITRTHLPRRLRSMATLCVVLRQLERGADIASGRRWMIFEGIRRFVLLADRMNRKSATRRAIFTHGSFYEFAHQSELQALGYTFDFPTRWARRVFDRTLTEDFLSEFEFLFTLSPAETADIRRLFPGLKGPGRRPTKLCPGL